MARPHLLWLPLVALWPTLAQAEAPVLTVRWDELAAAGGLQNGEVLPGTPVTGGVTVLEHCLLSIESAPFMTPLGVPLRACFSAGVVEVGPRDTLQQVLSEADRRLYRMKSTGRLELPDL